MDIDDIDRDLLELEGEEQLKEDAVTAATYTKALGTKVTSGAVTVAKNVQHEVSEVVSEGARISTEVLSQAINIADNVQEEVKSAVSGAVTKGAKIVTELKDEVSSGARSIANAGLKSLSKDVELKDLKGGLKMLGNSKPPAGKDPFASMNQQVTNEYRGSARKASVAGGGNALSMFSNIAKNVANSQKIVNRSISEGKVKVKIREGRYQNGEFDASVKPFVFVANSILQSSAFSAVEMFKMMDLPVPNIIMRLPEIENSDTWNIKLPSHRSHLSEKNVQAKPSRTHNVNVQQLKGVLTENCKRLLNGTASACQQAGAIFRVNGKTKLDRAKEDCAVKWVKLKQKNAVVVAIVDIKDLHSHIWKQFDEGCVIDYDTQLADGETIDNVILDLVSPFADKENDEAGTYPNVSATHLILTDNINLLEQKLSDSVPWGLV